MRQALSVVVAATHTPVGTRLTKPAVPGAPTEKNALSHSVPGLSFTRRSQKGTP